MSTLFLFFSVLLASVRNILSKSISNLDFGTRSFFRTQSVIFLCGAFVLLLLSGFAVGEIAGLTFLYAILYGLLLLSAQYCYTIALKKGKVGICSTVYSLGFIIPTISGCLFWQETLTLWNGIGILLVIPTILLSALSSPKVESQKNHNGYVLPLIAAMLSSGGLGIMQKVQQTSPYPEQKGVFIILAFAFAGMVSLFISCCAKKTPGKLPYQKIFAAGGIGIAFGGSNLLNTMLAGMLPISVYTPLLNIGTILISIVSGIILFHEKLSRKDIFILILGISAILLITAT